MFLGRDGRLTDGTGGVLWRDGLELPVSLRPTDIDDRGQIVGSRRVGDAWHAFRWDDGVLTRLGEVGRDLGPFLLRPYGPVAVNESGHALGLREDAAGRIRHMLWAGGYAIDLGTAGLRQSSLVLPVLPFALSDQGHVVVTELGDDGAPDRALLWTMTYPGDPAPPDDECILANNWAHVREGRATSYLVYAWAAGSETYLGLTTGTTALRRSGPDTWDLVDSCQA